MKRVFGIETEYGITVDGMEALDVVRESIEIVRSYTEHGASMKWDYNLEDPHQDARGFRAQELLQDTDEAAYFEIDKDRPLSFEEIKSDLVLSNGARFYNDHAHPEYSTPECTTLAEIVAQDEAGERILGECCRRRNQRLPEGCDARLYKNNTDFVGHSYGCHDNYLMRRDVPWERIVREVVPFLVTRQIFAGAGKMGVEGEDAAGQPGLYQIAQRSDFFSVLCSIDTMNRRPAREYARRAARRFRAVPAFPRDHRRCQYEPVRDRAEDRHDRARARPDRAGEGARARTRESRSRPPSAISRDQTYRWLVELRDGRKISGARSPAALSRRRARALRTGLHADVAVDPRANGRPVLNDLANRRHCAARTASIGWRRSICSPPCRRPRGSSGADPWLQSIDLEYHNVSLEDGLFYELVRCGQMRRLVTRGRSPARHFPSAGDHARLFPRPRRGAVQSRDFQHPVGRNRLRRARAKVHGEAAGPVRAAGAGAARPGDAGGARLRGVREIALRSAKYTWQS